MDVLPVYQVKEGRFFTAEENLHAERLCLLGTAIADSLFGSLDPIDREVRVNGLPFKVIGVSSRTRACLADPAWTSL